MLGRGSASFRRGRGAALGRELTRRSTFSSRGPVAVLPPDKHSLRKYVPSPGLRSHPDVCLGSSWSQSGGTPPSPQTSWDRLPDFWRNFQRRHQEAPCGAHSPAQRGPQSWGD